MTTATPRGRHRADRPVTTPISIVARAAVENAGALARKGALAAAGAGVLVSTLAPTAHAAPANDVGGAIKTLDLEAITSQARSSLALAPTFSVPADAGFTVEQAPISVTAAPKVVPIGNRAVSIALQYVGIRYTWGGTTPSTGFDCSGLINYVYDKLGVDLPRTSSQLRYAGTVVSNPRAGDIVWRSGHVALYAGNGMIIEASQPGVPVRYVELNWSTATFIRVT
ncbi:C40 family peptidase [Antribacter gilvus]|uniref:C40 family peptidase n=1 Tax=Antribacter gilvus TaxID=2304675 RepID=UPI000F7B5038|nr:C40 family peptidase [Antribacter gilvus]